MNWKNGIPENKLFKIYRIDGKTHNPSGAVYVFSDAEKALKEGKKVEWKSYGE